MFFSEPGMSFCFRAAAWHSRHFVQRDIRIENLSTQRTPDSWVTSRWGNDVSCHGSIALFRAFKHIQKPYICRYIRSFWTCSTTFRGRNIWWFAYQKLYERLVTILMLVSVRRKTDPSPSAARVDEVKNCSFGGQLQIGSSHFVFSTLWSTIAVGPSK